MTDTQAAPVSGSILVVGGGISGLTTALEAAEVGYDVILVEKNPYLGGRVAQLNQYFPKLCPPSCGLEINFRRIKDNPRVKVLTMAEVEKITGSPGAFEATVKIAPRLVNENCTCCGECAKVCQTEIDDAYNLNMAKTKAARLPHSMAFPARYVIDASVRGTDDGKRIAEACKYGAVELDMAPKTVALQVGAVVWATGWEPYDASRIDNLKFGVYPNVITNMMMERLAAVDGPTTGKILRPSDGAAPASVAFVQCAGSRDENHLPYCSYICCMASLKQATYVRKQYPDTKVYIFYIDIRSPGDRYEKFYNMVKDDENVILIKGKVAEVTEDPTTRAITVVAENAVTGEKIRQTVDMAVLATGMQPTAATAAVPGALKKTDDGFIINDFAGGLMAAGCAGKPADVYSSNQNATGMALKAIQTLARK